jgi:hypothetical protein
MMGYAMPKLYFPSTSRLYAHTLHCLLLRAPIYSTSQEICTLASVTRPAAPDRALARRAPWIRMADSGSRPFGLRSLARIMNPSPGALGPACRLRRRYAHAPAGAFQPVAGLANGLRYAPPIRRLHVSKGFLKYPLAMCDNLETIVQLRGYDRP